MSSHYGGSHYASSHRLSSHFGRQVLVPPVVEDESGSAWNPNDYRQRERKDFYREQILREDEELLVILQAFLHVMDD
jgi:hypothetical protein